MYEYAPQFPLDLEESGQEEHDGISVHQLSYASPKGGRVPASLVVPPGPGPFAGVLFLHPLPGDRTLFLDEALLLARKGAVSLLIDAPQVRPEPWQPIITTPEALRDVDVQTMIDLQRGVDVLTSQAKVDRQRLGYVGHSYGATQGGILAGLEKRIKAYILLAGLPSPINFFRYSAHPTAVQARDSGEELDLYLRLMEPLEPLHYISHAAPATVYFQFGMQDEFVSAQAAQQYFAAASEPKYLKWYEADHHFNAEARQDRLAWLQEQLALV